MGHQFSQTSTFVCYRRVHITQTTADHLQGEYELENGAGAERSPYLHQRGTDTFLVLPAQPRKVRPIELTLGKLIWKIHSFRHFRCTIAIKSCQWSIPSCIDWKTIHMFWTNLREDVKIRCIGHLYSHIFSNPTVIKRDVIILGDLLWFSLNSRFINVSPRS